MFPQENGDIVCLTTEYGNEGGTTNYLISLVKHPYDQGPAKTTLTLACTGLDYTVKSEILKFNRMDGDYRIEVRDYPSITPTRTTPPATPSSSPR